MDGIINVHKPKGITSFDVIRQLRKYLKIKRIGHTGTLDPLAEGVLIVCVGKATKLVQDIEGYSKTYLAGFDLGYRTDTYDIEGNVIEKVENVNISLKKFSETLKFFLGDTKQIPPMYSAIKIDGQKLYNLARKGIEVERKPREIHIDFIEIIEFDGQKGIIKCKVSKGTYIRSLIDDLGKALKTFATMTSLVRCAIKDTTLANAITLEKIEESSKKNNFDFVISVEDYFVFDKINITTQKDFILFSNGNTIKHKASNGKYRIYNNGNFLGLGIVNNNLLKGYKYF